MPHLESGQAVKYRVRVPGYQDSSFYSNEEVNADLTLNLNREARRVLIKVLGDSGVDLSLHIEDRNAAGLALAKISVRDGQGSSEMPGEWIGKKVFIGPVPIAESYIAFDATENLVNVDLSDVLGTVVCKKAPRDLVLMVQGRFVGGVGVGADRIEWRGMMPGKYLLMPRRYLFQGASDRGVAVELTNSGHAVVEWGDVGAYEGSAVADSPEFLFAAPLVPAASGVQPLFGMAVRIARDGRFSLRPGFEISDVAICQERDGVWRMLATGGVRQQIPVYKLRRVELVSELCEDWDDDKAWSAQLHGADGRGRRILAVEIRPVRRVGRHIVVDDVPQWIKEITLDVGGKRWIGRVSPTSSSCQLLLRH